MTKKALLLGATGFIGKNLAELIKKDDRYVLFSPNRSELNLLDAEACRVYLERTRPDYVIHCAVDISSVERSLQSFFNILNNKNLFGHLIQIGSGAEYDRRICLPGVHEADFGKSIPVDTYGMAKYVIARELEIVGASKASNFRLFGVFGKYEDVRRRFISNNILRVLADLPISVNQDVIFDYVDVRDFCEFLLSIMPRLPLLDVSYNFCSGKPKRLSDIGRIIKSRMNVNEDVQVKNAQLGREYSGSSTKLFSELDSFEFRSMDESISDLIDYYRENMTEELISAVRG